VKCHELEHKFEAYLAGNLTPADNLYIEHHLDSCPQCMVLLLQDDPLLDRLLTSEWYMHPAPDITSRVMRAIRKPRVPAWAWSAVALSAFMAFGLVSALVLLFSPLLGFATDAWRYLTMVWHSLVLGLRLAVTALGYYELSVFALILFFGLATAVLVGTVLLSREEFV